MELGDFVDMNGYVVSVGTAVGFTEFSEMSEMSLMGGKSDLSYVVVALPNLGDMVDMTEIVWDEGKSGDDFRIVNSNNVISVEPWKIGAI